MESKEITIAGKSFAVSQPYAEGHVITEAEAKALNQVRAENIRNNMASKVKIAFEAPTDDITETSIGALVAEYDAAYVFTLASVGGGKRSADPVEVEALKMARQLFSDALKAKGIALNKVPEDTRNAKIAEIAARDIVMKEAAKRVATRKKQAADMLDGMDLDGITTEGEGEGAAE